MQIDTKRKSENFIIKGKEKFERKYHDLDKWIKVTVTAIASGLSALLGTLYVPVLLMVLCNVIDYVTGLMAARYRDGISSYKSIRGIYKKVSMWLLVVIGAIVDALLKYATDSVGISVHFSFLIAAVVAVWIICNELISILENMIDIGISVPPFLIPIVKHIKSYAEKEADIEGREDGDKSNCT